MDDEELRHIFTIDMTKSRVGRYLAERRGQGTRIAGQFCSSCISHELTFARNGKASEQGKEVVNSSTDYGHNDHHDDACSSIVLSRSARTSASPKEVSKHATREQGEHGGKDTYKHDADNEHSGVTIADVGEFMCYHTCEFLIVEQVNDACCEGDGVGLLVDA